MTYTTEQIAKLLADITPGEWSYCEYHPWVRWGDREPEPSYELDGPIFSTVGYDTLDREGDAAFIAAAPAIVAQQQKQIAALTSKLEDAISIAETGRLEPIDVDYLLRALDDSPIQKSANLCSICEKNEAIPDYPLCADCASDVEQRVHGARK